MRGVAQKIKVPVFYSKEGRSFVAYSPALDLSSCGRTLAQAQKRFSTAVALFLGELEDMGTLDSVLTELGWKKQSRSPKEWVAPHLLKRAQLEVRIPAHS
jgi:hypothetical protein